MSEVLTREMFDRFTEQAFRFTPREPQIVCHPLDAPFINALLNRGVDVIKVYDLWSECKRKYLIGKKRGIDKWAMQPLVEQYTQKLNVPC